ncbi:hypothetical protein F5880DRAFT_1618840 [Lentinula raphanica]|nr:hypothetical protein F5880DRAFT_1618840 [Lentinula raphanica]
MNTNVALAANDCTTPFSFKSQAGHALIAQIVQLYAPFRPHDYVLDGIGEMLDGKDLVAITPTGSGKTGYIAFTALVVRELTRYPKKYLEAQNAAKRFPKNPLMLAICPTNYLEYQLLTVGSPGREDVKYHPRYPYHQQKHTLLEAPIGYFKLPKALWPPKALKACKDTP